MSIFLAVLAITHAVAEPPDDRSLRQFPGPVGHLMDEVKALPARGAKPAMPDSSGRTALHGAASIGAVETARALIRAGGSPNRQNTDGNTPLHVAANAPGPKPHVGDSTALGRLLLKAGANACIHYSRGFIPVASRARATSSTAHSTASTAMNSPATRNGDTSQRRQAA